MVKESPCLLMITNNCIRSFRTISAEVRGSHASEENQMKLNFASFHELSIGGVSNCCLAPTQQLFNYIMARTS